MADVTKVGDPIEFDESISHYEIHSHKPKSSNFANSDEIRIPIQFEDLYLLPSRSVIHICGQLKAPRGKPALANTKFVNNAICFLFQDIRYELQGVEIDRCKNVGLSTLMKNWVSFNPNQSMLAENSGWIGLNENKKINNDAGYFDVCIPLSMIFGFAEDYNKIIVNLKHELILTRARNDYNAIVQSGVTTNDVMTYEDFEIEINLIEWLMPHVTLSYSKQIEMLKFIGMDKPIVMSFRSREFLELPVLPRSLKHTWSMKTSNQLEKPRMALVAFQTDRRFKKEIDASLFDNINIYNAQFILNSRGYPYSNMNINIEQNQTSILYDMFTYFQFEHYHKDPEPALSKEEFIKKVPIIVFDCSKQKELTHNSPVDVSLEIESRAMFPENTAAYSLIIHDRIITYSPMGKEVKKLIDVLK